MLSYISIKNIVLIDKLELNFKKGFTVLTGETGAGKSIIVDAINLLLGNRADRRLIKKGQNEASVSALFSVNQNHEVRNILTKYGLVAENENTYANTDHAAGDLADGSETSVEGSGGVELDASNSFPAGITIYGRYTEIDVAGGTIIAYWGK